MYLFLNVKTHHYEKECNNLINRLHDLSDDFL